jgi:CHAD domain-containing protein
MATAAGEILGARLGDVRWHDARLRRRPARGAVHDARVSTRRLRAAIRLLANGKLGRLEKNVKDLQDSLGQVRDLQLQVQWLQSQAHGRGVRAVAAEQKRQLTDSARELKRRLVEWRQDVAPALQEALGDVRTQGRLGGGRMRRLLRKRLTKVIEQLRLFHESNDPQTVHRLRIALKKLRYQVEILEPAFPAYSGLAMSVLVPLQSELGSIHDKDVRLELLEERRRAADGEARAEIDSLHRNVRNKRRREVNTLQEKIEWLLSEKIPERLSTLLA